jgi:hypothetical protein
MKFTYSKLRCIGSYVVGKMFKMNEMGTGEENQRFLYITPCRLGKWSFCRRPHTVRLIQG